MGLSNVITNEFLIKFTEMSSINQFDVAERIVTEMGQNESDLLCSDYDRFIDLISYMKITPRAALLNGFIPYSVLKELKTRNTFIEIERVTKTKKAN